MAITQTDRDELLTLAGRVAPRHTALLVVDMQNDFCAPGSYVERVVGKDPSPCAAIAPAVQRLVELARAAGAPVIWLRADYRYDGLPENMRARLREHGITDACCVPGTWGYDWYGVSPVPGEPLIDKHCYDGFVGTPLDATLKDRGIRSIVFAGVQTNVCVEATLRHAQALGYYCVVAEECVASHTRPAHDGMLATVRFLLGDVVSLADMAGLWATTSNTRE